MVNLNKEKKEFIKGRIFMIPIPIGELSINELLNPEYTDTVRNTRVWVVENVRTVRRYLSSLHLGIKIDEILFFELHRDFKKSELDAFLEKNIQKGDIGVASEAGLPGMADPGSVVALWGHQNNIEVIPLTGPGSVMLALMASGLNGQQFTFHGYAPIKEPELKSFLGEISRQTMQRGYTQIFIEAPYRSDRFFQFLIQTIHPELLVCIAFSLHNNDQWINTKTVAEWKKQMPELGKNPCVFLIGKTIEKKQLRFENPE